MTSAISKPAGRALAAAALIALAGAAVAEEAGPPPSGLSVSVRQARRMCFANRVEVTGVLLARQEVEVGVDREGLKVAQVLAAPLDKVAAGQALATLATIDGAPSPGGPVVLRAPVAGLVLRSQASVGAPVSPRHGALFQIVARGEIDFQAEAPLAALAKLAVGQSVAVTPLGLTEIAGKIRQVDGGLDPASQLGRVKVALAAGPDLRIGAFARGIVTLPERCGIGAPYAAVMREADGTIVHTIENDRVVTRQVSIGLLSGTDVEIVSGLSEADRVVARAGAFLREGDRVHPILTRDPVEARGGGQSR